MRVINWWGLIGSVALLLGCGASEEGADLVLFGDREYGYGCDEWQTERPPARMTVVDVPAWGSDKDLIGPPVVRWGGWQVAEFNAPRVRIAIPVDSIPALYANGLVGHQNVSFTVADTLDRSVRVIVLLSDTMTTADLDRATAAGAVIVDVYLGLNGYVAIAHDSLLPHIPTWPNVNIVDATAGILVCNVIPNGPDRSGAVN
jgi:hypothetical protein